MKYSPRSEPGFQLETQTINFRQNVWNFKISINFLNKIHPKKLVDVVDFRYVFSLEQNPFFWTPSAY